MVVASVSGSKVHTETSKRNELKANLAGGAVGLAIPAYTVYASVRKLSNSEAKEMAEFMSSFMPEVDTFENTKNTAAKILEETGLKAKGVKITFIDKTKETLDHLKEVVGAGVKGNSAYRNRMSLNYFETFKEGANAAFFSNSNDIIVNNKRLYSSTYHEIGHALNANGNWFTKALQKARPITPFGVSVFAPALLAVGLLHKVDKTKPESEKGKVEKSLDFISNNAGKLTLASYVPLLAEEGLASIRGLKQAAKHLPKETVGKLAWNYTKAWGTYAGLAVAVAGGVAAGIHLANKMKNPDKV